MGNYLSVGNATAALKYMVQNWVAYTIPDLDIQVTSLQPKQTEDIYRDAGGVNIYLYQTEFNANFRNNNLAMRNSQGDMIAQPFAPLDLYYLITFFGDEQKYVAQRLFGSVTELFTVHPHLTPEVIRAANSLQDNKIFAESGLDKQDTKIPITPCNLSLEEKSKMWSFFFQTPYHLSTVFRVSNVFIEGNYPLPSMHKVLHREINIDPIAEIEGKSHDE